MSDPTNTAPERIHIVLDEGSDLEDVTYEGIMFRGPGKNFSGDIITTEYVKASLHTAALERIAELEEWKRNAQMALGCAYCGEDFDGKPGWINSMCPGCQGEEIASEH
jgi:hypothetical protein